METVYRVLVVLLSVLTTAYIFNTEYTWLTYLLMIGVVLPLAVSVLTGEFKYLPFEAKAIGVSAIFTGSFILLDPASAIAGAIAGFILNESVKSPRPRKPLHR